MKQFVLLIIFFSISIINAAGFPVLTDGDSVAVVAPSNAPTAGSLEKVRGIFDSGKLACDIPSDMVAVGQPFGRANTIKYRAAHLLGVLESTKVKVIWAIRGGRGASEIFLDDRFFDFTRFKDTKPKLCVGFSDFTVVHLWAARVGWPSLHGVVLNFNKEMEQTVNKDTSLGTYFDILRGKVPSLAYDLNMDNQFAAAPVPDSSVIGGNLSLIQRSIGTPLALDTKGKILFLEDIGEEGARVHEALVQLERAGLMDAPKAVIWGDFQSTSDAAGIAVAKEFFLERMEARKIPVFSSGLFGHGLVNMPLPFGMPTEIKNGKLTVRLLASS